MELKINTAKLTAVMKAYKSLKAENDLPVHEAWVPAPEKEIAKANGARWNAEAKRYEFASSDPDSHPCSRYLSTNFLELRASVPFNLGEEFKELGVITKNVGGKWKSYVMAHEDYIEVINALREIDLL